MNVHKETEIRIEFANGVEITPIVVVDGEEKESKIFSKATHQIEELIQYISDGENEGDVYL